MTHLDVTTEKIKAALFVRPTRSLDRHCLRNAGDAVALADQVKEVLRDFVKPTRPSGWCATTKARSQGRASSATG